MEILNDLPSWVPAECQDAAKQLLGEKCGNNYKYEAECKRILTDNRLKAFWGDAAESFTRYWQDQGKPGGVHLGGLKGFFRSLILRMVSKGGNLPSENLADKKKRRVEIAKQLKKIRSLINQDESLSLVGIVDLAKFCAEIKSSQDIKERGQSAVNILGKLRSGTITLDLSGPKLPDILLALEEQLEQVKPIDSFDDLEYHPAMPQVGRKNVQKIFLERVLIEFFITYTGDSNVGLVSTAVEVAINTDDAIDPDDLWNRYRSYRKG